MSFSDIHPGDPINAINVQQVIDALKGTAGKGVPLTVSAVNDSARYALTLENTEATNSRALNVLKNDGSVLIRADATGVTLGQPLNLPTGSITSGAIADGTIATADLANNAVTNVKLGTDTARLNLLTNGGFEIWQRGISFSSVTTDTIHADYWHTSPAAGSSFTTVQRTATAGFTDGSPFSYGATYVHSASSNVFQKYEGWGSLPGKTVSLSVRVRTTTANAVRVFVNDGVTTQNGTAHTGGDTWQTLTLTVTLAANATQLIVGLNLIASCTFYADNAMLVVGSVPADYAPLHPADDLARCLRYYEIPYSGTSGVVTAQAYAATNFQAYLHWLPKAITPTFTISAASDFSVTNAAAGGLPVTALPATVLGLTSCLSNGTVASGLVAGNATNLNGANANAKIIIEANP